MTCSSLIPGGTSSSHSQRHARGPPVAHGPQVAHGPPVAGSICHWFFQKELFGENTDVLRRLLLGDPPRNGSSVLQPHYAREPESADVCSDKWLPFDADAERQVNANGFDAEQAAERAGASASTSATGAPVERSNAGVGGSVSRAEATRTTSRSSSCDLAWESLVREVSRGGTQQARESAKRLRTTRRSIRNRTDEDLDG